MERGFGTWRTPWTPGEVFFEGRRSQVGTRVGGRGGWKPESGGTLTGRPSGKEALDADVLVEVGPMNALTATDQPGMGSLGGAPVKEAWIPGQWGGDGASVGQLNDQRIIGNLHCGGLEGCGIKNQSSHASAARVGVGAARSNGKDVDLRTGKPGTRRQRNRFEPKFRLGGVTLDVDMSRFVVVAGIKEEAVGTRTQNSRHGCGRCQSERLQPR